MAFKCKLKITTTSRVGFDKYTDDEYLDIYGGSIEEIQNSINILKAARSSITGDFGLTLSNTTIEIESLQKIETELVVENLNSSIINLS